MSSGIFQEAHQDGSGNATVTLTNDGSISIGAVAEADGLTASAFAYVTDGILQFATQHLTGTGNASITLTNNGDIDITAAASAEGDNAFASATVSNAIYQSASATDGDASVSLVNAAATGTAARSCWRARSTATG